MPSRFLEQMVTIRRVEQSLLDLFDEGYLNGTVHTCIGQEACAVGMVNALDRQTDILFSNHRGHGHYLAYCDDVEGLIAEVFGAPSGVCNGVGGSQHLHRGNFFSNGIQGAGTPIVVGMALGEKLRGSGAVCVAFLGDGTFGEGVVYEAMNLASLWRLPIIFAIEHNRYAQSTPSELQHAGSLAERPAAFGIPVYRVDGMDVMAVHRTASEVVRQCRADSAPRAILMETYRYAPHSKGDDFRDPAEIETYRQRDPIQLLLEEFGDELKALHPDLEHTASNRVSAIVEQLRDEMQG